MIITHVLIEKLFAEIILDVPFDNCPSVKILRVTSLAEFLQLVCLLWLVSDQSQIDVLVTFEFNLMRQRIFNSPSLFFDAQKLVFEIHNQMV